MELEDNGVENNYQPKGLNKKKLMIAFTQKKIKMIVTR